MNVNTTTCEVSELDLALLGAQRDVVSIAKDAKNEFHNYRYVSSESMVAECRVALHNHGLVLSSFGTSTISAIDHTAINKESHLEVVTSVIVMRSFILSHPASGQSRTYNFPFAAVPEKGRPIDKAIAGAMTSSLNYFLRDLLLVPRGDENEMDRRVDLEPPAAQRPVATLPVADTVRSPKQQAVADCRMWAGLLPEAKAEEVIVILTKLRSTLFPNFKEGDILDDSAWANMVEYMRVTPYKEWYEEQKAKP